MAVTSAALSVPFLIAAPLARYRSRVQSRLAQPRWMDPFSLVARLRNKLHIWLPNAEIVLLYTGPFVALTLPVLVRRALPPAQWTLRLVLLLGFVFLFGKLASCDYYQFFALLLPVHLSLDGSGRAMA